MSFGQDVRASLNAPLRLEDLLRYARIVGALMGLGVVWGSLYAKINDCQTAMKLAAERGERIERYLASKDPNYYETARKQRD